MSESNLTELSDIEVLRTVYSNHSTTWDKYQKRILKKAFKRGTELADISLKLGRSPNSMLAMLHQMDLLECEDGGEDGKYQIGDIFLKNGQLFSEWEDFSVRNVQ